ncbi:TetR/AcrR family transcriptional regulator [Mesorhizobium sp. CAU 1732]|uniref:TetR/AcrR family transcriptional regulator n=1 Tax=Mesorhizobium sp. CAU 1732 TaxID=3140358 RepID=UPI00326177AA
MNSPSDRPITEAEVKRARILESARTLFIRYGFKRTSIGDIAGGAGVSRPGVYTHFASKNEILATLMEIMRQAAVRLVVDDVAPRPASLSFRIAAILDTQICAIERLVRDASYEMEAVEPTWRGAREILQRHLAQVEELIAHLLESQGVVIPGAARMFTAAAYGTLRSDKADPDTRRAGLRLHVDTLVAGLERPAFDGGSRNVSALPGAEKRLARST